MQDNTRLFLGGCPKLLALEDLALNLSLDETRYIFFELLEGYKQALKEHQVAAMFNERDFFEVLKTIGMDKFTDRLYNKSVEYTAGVFRKTQRLFDKNMLFVHNLLVDKVYDAVCIVK